MLATGTSSDTDNGAERRLAATSSSEFAATPIAASTPLFARSLTLR
jgi:hypothetical protein